MCDFIAVINAVIVTIGVVGVGAVDVGFVVVAQSVAVGIGGGGPWGHLGLNLRYSEDFIKNFHFVNCSIKALPSRISSVTSVTTNDHWEGVSCHRAAVLAGSFDSVNKDNLIGAIV